MEKSQESPRQPVDLDINSDKGKTTLTQSKIYSIFTFIDDAFQFLLQGRQSLN